MLTICSGLRVVGPGRMGVAEMDLSVTDIWCSGKDAAWDVLSLRWSVCAGSLASLDDRYDSTPALGACCGNTGINFLLSMLNCRIPENHRILPPEGGILASSG